jgi:putative transposase
MMEPKLSRRQRKLARTVKGSRNREKARLRVARAHRKVRNQRKDFLHQLSRMLVDEYDLIAFEDLTIGNMVKNHRLSKSIYDAGWGLLIGMTDAKAERAGRRVTSEEPAGTSQKCSSCGKIVRKPLSERTHRCPHCGLEKDRDWNAAGVVLGRTMAVFGPAHRQEPPEDVSSQIGREPTESKPVESRASTARHRVAPRAGSMKQDASPFTGW